MLEIWRVKFIQENAQQDESPYWGGLFKWKGQDGLPFYNVLKAGDEYVSFDLISLGSYHLNAARPTTQNPPTLQSPTRARLKSFW